MVAEKLIYSGGDKMGEAMKEVDGRDFNKCRKSAGTYRTGEVSVIATPFGEGVPGGSLASDLVIHRCIHTSIYIHRKCNKNWLR